MDINGNTATGSGFGKLNFTGLFLSVIHLEFVIIERLSVLVADSGLGLLEKSKNGRMAERPMAPSWKGGEGQPSVGSNPTSSSIGKDSIFVWCSTGHCALLVGLNEKPRARGCA